MVELGPSDRLVLSAITSRAALSRPVRTISSRSTPSPTLIWLVAGPTTRTTSFLTTAASPTRAGAYAGLAAKPAATHSAEIGRTQKRKLITNTARSITPPSYRIVRARDIVNLQHAAHNQLLDCCSRNPNTFNAMD